MRHKVKEYIYRFIKYLMYTIIIHLIPDVKKNKNE